MVALIYACFVLAAGAAYYLTRPGPVLLVVINVATLSIGELALIGLFFRGKIAAKEVDQQMALKYFGFGTQGRVSLLRFLWRIPRGCLGETVEAIVRQGRVVMGLMALQVVSFVAQLALTATRPR